MSNLNSQTDPKYQKLILFTLNLFFLLIFFSFFTLPNVLDISSPLNQSLYYRNLILLVVIITQIVVITKLSRVQFIGRKEYHGKEYTKIFLFLIKTQHHNECDCFKYHEFTVNDKLICSGCYGTITGLLVNLSILGMFLLFENSFQPSDGLGIFLISVLVIQIHFFKYFFKIKMAQLRFTINLLFPIGLNLLILSFLILEIGNLGLLVVLMLIIPEIGLRLLFSHLDHEDIICSHNIYPVGV